MRLGINLENQNNVIKNNNYNCSVLKENISKIVTNCNRINGLYSGNDIQFLFSGVVDQSTSLNNIVKILENYSVFLKDVENSYIDFDKKISLCLSDNDGK